MGEQISVNGVTYQSVDEMPPDVRALHEQAMALLGAVEARGEGSTHIERDEQHIRVDGRSYDRVEDLPPETRAAVEATFAAMEGLLSPGARGADAPSRSAPAYAAAPRPPDPIYMDEREYDRRTRAPSAALVVALLVAAAALVGITTFFLMS